MPVKVLLPVPVLPMLLRTTTMTLLQPPWTTRTILMTVVVLVGL